MHRRNLILRRFGALSFGLGYFDAGTWVDHTALPDRGRDLAIAGVSVGGRSVGDPPAAQLLHRTDDGRAIPRAVTAIPIRSGSPPCGARSCKLIETDVDAVARRSSAR